MPLNTEQEEIVCERLAELGVTLGVNISSKRIANYLRIIENEHFDDIMWAIYDAERGCERFPSPAKLLSLINKHKAKRRAEKERSEYEKKLEKWKQEATPPPPEFYEKMAKLRGKWSALKGDQT
jgi:hypothetical protein